MDVICRLCGEMISPPKFVKCTIKDKYHKIKEKLIDCCRWAQYQSDENLPENICNACFECLQQSWRFCEQVTATQIHLREMFPDWKSDSQSSPIMPTFDDVKLDVKDEFLDDDDEHHSFEELPMNSTWDEDEMIIDVNRSHQIKVEPLINWESVKIANGDNSTSPLHSERSDKAEIMDDDDEETIEDNEKLDTNKIKFPQCLEPNDLNADGTVDPKAIARLNLCDWTIYQHQCHECEMIFVDNIELRLHYKQQHSLEGIRYKCWLCAENRSYAKRNTLIRHIGRHHIYHLALCCAHCNKHFWSSRWLKTHKQQRAKCRTPLKTNVKSVVCEHCGMLCSTAGNYRAHKYAQHLSKDLKTVFECYACKSIHDSRNKLKRHMIMHHIGKKLVQCTVCNLVLNKQSLSRHIKIHSDEMPFVCSFSKTCGTPCGKAFKFSRSLEAHERIHTGYRPYKCRAEGCDYATSDGGNIYKHMKQKHKMVFPKK